MRLQPLLPGVSRLCGFVLPSDGSPDPQPREMEMKGAGHSRRRAARARETQPFAEQRGQCRSGHGPVPATRLP